MGRPNETQWVIILVFKELEEKHVGDWMGWRIEVEDEYDQNIIYACMKFLKINLNYFIKNENFQNKCELEKKGKRLRL